MRAHLGAVRYSGLVNYSQRLLRHAQSLRVSWLDFPLPTVPNSGGKAFECRIMAICVDYESSSWVPV